jgi:aminomethyltransferase
MPERRTPFYDFHRRSARDLVVGGGEFVFPSCYTSPVEEHLGVRRRVGMQDLSTMGEIDVKGPGAERLLRHLLVNEVLDLEVGQLRYSTMCNEAGGIVDDVTVYKFADEHYMVVSSSGPRKKVFRWISEHARGTSAYVTDVTAAVALPVVQGPRSRAFLKTLVDGVDLDALRFFRFAPARIGDVELIVSRSGYTGELGYELYTPAEEAGALWERLLAAGREFGLVPYGVQAMQSLRIEKSLPLYGSDINEDYTPFHAGLDRFIRFDKPRFVGREALLRVQERGLRKRWVGLTLQSEAPAAVGDGLYAVSDVASFRETMRSGAEAGEEKDALMPAEAAVGHVTCSAVGPSVGRTLAMAYVDTAHSWPGRNLLVEANGRPVAARVVPTPFFDPQNARVRAEAAEDDLRVEPSPEPVPHASYAEDGRDGSPSGGAPRAGAARAATSANGSA